MKNEKDERNDINIKKAKNSNKFYENRMTKKGEENNFIVKRVCARFLICRLVMRMRMTKYLRFFANLSSYKCKTRHKWSIKIWKKNYKSL